MTVISMIPNDTPFLPPKVTEVPKDVLRNFPHSKKVGNYLLGSTLGEGSFAKVKEALHIPTGERVAVKIIDKKKTRDDSYVRKNLRREGKILQMIRHDNIIQLFEIMETQNSYYLVTEMCKGGDLMDYISQKRKLPENEVKKYIRQIVSAVDYLHRLGILHRDLKIENLLLDESKDMKIIDFGLSNCVKLVQTKDGPKVQDYCVTQCGSPAYAAPELLGRKKYGPQVDVWSIGVNMYAMLTGNLPFTVEPFNIKALHNKMITGQMNPLPETISRECRDIIKKLLNPDPDRRISIEEILKHPWIAEGSGQPLTRAACPNRVKIEALDNSILKHMSENQGYRIGEIIRFVTGNVPSSASAMYYLIHRKLAKHYGHMRASGKIAADHRILQRTQLSSDPGKTSPKVFTSLRVQRAQNNATLPNSKNASSKDNNDNEAVRENSKEEEEEKSGTEDGFTDILQTKGTNGVVQIPRASPIHKKEHFAEKYSSAQLRVSNKYVTGRKTVTSNTAPSSADCKSDKTHYTELEQIATDTCDTEEEQFRPRASTLPGNLDRPDVLLDKLLKEHNNDESKEKTGGAVKTKLYKNKSDSKNSSNKDNSDGNRRGSPYQRDVSRSPGPRSTSTGQPMVQFRKHPPGIQRRIISTQRTKDNDESKDSIHEDDISISTIKHILSRPSRTNRFIRVPPANSIAREERAVLEHVSEILSARIASPRPANLRSGTPMLPILSPNSEVGKRT